MALSVHGLYSNYSISKDQLLSRSYRFKQQNLIKENMAMYYQKKKPSKIDYDIVPISTLTWKDEDKAEREKSRVATNKGYSFIGIKVVGQSLMTDNEVRKINQNNVYDKLLNLEKKDLDNQLRFNMIKLKREKSILTEKYIDLQAYNYKFIKNIQNRRDSHMSNQTFSSVFSALGGYPSTRRSIHSAPAKIKQSSFDLFKREQADLESRISSAYHSDPDQIPDRLNLKTPEKYKPFLESLKDKFVDQKLRCNPNYQKKKRKTKYSMTLEDLDKILGKFKFDWIFFLFILVIVFFVCLFVKLQRKKQKRFV